jgi:hypothetical protein
MSKLNVIAVNGKLVKFIKGSQSVIGMMYIDGLNGLYFLSNNKYFDGETCNDKNGYLYSWHMGFGNDDNELEYSNDYYIELIDSNNNNAKKPQSIDGFYFRIKRCNSKIEITIKIPKELEFLFTTTQTAMSDNYGFNYYSGEYPSPIVRGITATFGRYGNPKLFIDGYFNLSFLRTVGLSIKKHTFIFNDLVTDEWLKDNMLSIHEYLLKLYNDYCTSFDMTIQTKIKHNNKVGK